MLAIVICVGKLLGLLRVLGGPNLAGPPTYGNLILCGMSQYFQVPRIVDFREHILFFVILISPEANPQRQPVPASTSHGLQSNHFRSNHYSQGYSEVLRW
jgi:hypothetical protein